MIASLRSAVGTFTNIQVPTETNTHQHSSALLFGYDVVVRESRGAKTDAEGDANEAAGRWTISSRVDFICQAMASFLRRRRCWKAGAKSESSQVHCARIEVPLRRLLVQCLLPILESPVSWALSANHRYGSEVLGSVQRSSLELLQIVLGIAHGSLRTIAARIIDVVSQGARVALESLTSINSAMATAGARVWLDTVQRCLLSFGGAGSAFKRSSTLLVPLLRTIVSTAGLARSYGSCRARSSESKGSALSSTGRKGVGVASVRRCRGTIVRPQS